MVRIVIVAVIVAWLAAILLPMVVLAESRKAIPNIPIRVIYVDGPGAVGVPIAEKMVDAAAALFQAVKIPVYREKTFYFNALTPECRSLDLLSRKACLDQWIAQLKKPLGIKGGVSLVVTPPLEGSFWGGIAYLGRIGRNDAFAVANIKERFVGDLISFGISVTVIAHEIGHELNMSHDDEGCSMMNPDAARCAQAAGRAVGPSKQSTGEAKRKLGLQKRRRR